MTGFARFWITSYALCVEDIALLALDGARWAHRRYIDLRRPPGHPHP